MFRETDEEEMTEDETKDMIDTIFERTLTEENDQKGNILKIEIVENSQASSGEDDQGSKYMMIARLQVGAKTNSEDQDEISEKAFKMTKGDWQQERQPP